jgi:hypothetical protein
MANKGGLLWFLVSFCFWGGGSLLSSYNSEASFSISGRFRGSNLLSTETRRESEGVLIIKQFAYVRRENNTIVYADQIRIWKDMDVAYLIARIPLFTRTDSGEIVILLSVSGNRIEIYTQYLRNTCPERCLYTKLFGSIFLYAPF